MLTCERAAAVLRGLEQNALVCEPDEIEDLLALGLGIEADPDDLMTLRWLQPVVREFSRLEVGDPNAIPALQEWLVKTNRDLSSDWYRMTTGAAERARRDQDKITIQRALGLLRDDALVHALRKIVVNAPHVAAGAQWVTCPELGVEHYALTIKGHRVLRSLTVRLERFAQASLKSFLHSFDKRMTKMRAFGVEVATLDQNIGIVKKNREQVIIGLAKTGVPAGHALGAYHSARARWEAPDAVTCARNAATFGSPEHAAQRLRMAQMALRHAGYPNTPIAIGAAKALLTFSPPEAGIPRFNELMQRLAQAFGQSEANFKLVTRLMPAVGQPAEIMQRVARAVQLLQQIPSGVSRVNDLRACAVTLGSMARTLDAMPELVKRFRDLEQHLARSGLSAASTIQADALECIGCPGTPAEVVDTMSVLVDQLAAGRQRGRGDVAIAAAFAKRFAY